MDWNFIEENYPNYYSCDLILLSDILRRKVEGEQISNTNKKLISDWDVKKVLTNLEEEIFLKALFSKSKK
ncbi:hypothetical protein ABS768_08935 [Flavobacterium sp. ST-75]|uniref:Uncharacterized protein n=1 Tax=Flavobacterium rhizophilum TaxID=3163296 RepID=A0ABW8YE74_9FLAO